MNTPTALLCLAALTVNAPAQTPPCASANDQTTAVASVITVWNSGGPNQLAWQWVAPTAMSLIPRGIRIYTENSYLSGFMKFAMHDNDPNNPGFPGYTLGGMVLDISLMVGVQFN